MCTVVILRRPDHPWPTLLAANRDEMNDRPWKPPARHWPDRPDVVAGLDLEAGGSWLGINDSGVAAAILNRPQSLGPAAGKRTRGELVLDALDSADAADVVDRFADLDGRAWRPFNMVIADNTNAWWLRNAGAETDWRIESFAIPEGLSMLTARELNDRESSRIARYLDRFRKAPAPDPDAEDWTGWRDLLADRERGPDGAPDSSMSITTEFGFATTSSSLIALPAADRTETAPVWLFAAGRPDKHAHEPVAALADRAPPLRAAG